VGDGREKNIGTLSSHTHVYKSPPASVNGKECMLILYIVPIDFVNLTNGSDNEIELLKTDFNS